MEAKFGGKAQVFGTVISNLKSVGKKSMEWDLNDWKWDGDLFRAAPLNSAPSDCKSKQLFPSGSEIPASTGLSNSSSSGSDGITLGNERGKGELEKQRRVVVIEDEVLNNEAGSINLKLGGGWQVYPITVEEKENWVEKSGKKTKLVGAASSHAVCQVEGCRVDLSNAKDYHRRHKKGHVDSGCKSNSEPQTSVQVTRSASDCNLSHEKMPSHSDTRLDRQTSPQYFCNDSAGVQEFATLQSVGEDKIQDKMGTRKDQLKLKRNLKMEGLLEAEAVLEGETMRVPTLKELNSWPLNHRKRLYFDSTELKLEVIMANLSRIVISNDINNILVDGGSASKKSKMEFSDLYGYTDRSSSSRDGSLIQDATLSSPIKEKRYDESCDETVVGQVVGDAERFFFPINPFVMKHVGLNDSSMPWKGVLSDNDESLQESFPNLELALGAVTKSLKKSMPPFLDAKVEKKVNQDQSTGRAATKAEEEDAFGAPSLLLSFPFPDKDQAVQPITKTKKLLPERRRINPSLLFGDFLDK